MTDYDKQNLTLEHLQKLAEDLLLRDKYLVPVIFICGRQGATVMEIPDEFMENDETKDYLVKELAKKLYEEKSHKIFFVSECWMYRIPPEMSEEELEKLAQTNAYRDVLECRESYQVIEITRDTVRMATKSFERTEDDIILLDDSLSTDTATLERFKPLQDALHPLD